MAHETNKLLITQQEKPNHYTYLKEFRVEQCQSFLQHKCNQHRPYVCFNWHFQNQRRRRPIRKRDGTFNYSADNYCTKYDETTGICPDGDDCPFLHRTAGDTERRYHLRYYKTCMCVHDTDSRGYCVKNGHHCAFAHGIQDQRPPVYDIKELEAMQNAELALDGTNAQNALDKERNLMNEDPKWQDTNFVLANYKTEPCKRPPRLCRQGYACPQYHNSKDKRRSPRKFKYRSTPCPNVKHGEEWGEPGNCEAGDNCQYCHTRTEQQFHPEIYKSTKCNDVQQAGFCPRSVFCAFAHVEPYVITEDKTREFDGISTTLALGDIISNALPDMKSKDNSNKSGLMTIGDNNGNTVDASSTDGATTIAKKFITGISINNNGSNAATAVTSSTTATATATVASILKAITTTAAASATLAATTMAAAVAASAAAPTTSTATAVSVIGSGKYETASIGNLSNNISNNNNNNIIIINKNINNENGQLKSQQQQQQQHENSIGGVIGSGTGNKLFNSQTSTASSAASAAAAPGSKLNNGNSNSNNNATNSNSTGNNNSNNNTNNAINASALQQQQQQQSQHSNTLVDSIKRTAELMAQMNDARLSMESIDTNNMLVNALEKSTNQGKYMNFSLPLDRLSIDDRENALSANLANSSLMTRSSAPINIPNTTLNNSINDFNSSNFTVNIPNNSLTYSPTNHTSNFFNISDAFNYSSSNSNKLSNSLTANATQNDSNNIFFQSRIISPGFADGLSISPSVRISELNSIRDDINSSSVGNSLFDNTLNSSKNAFSLQSLQNTTNGENITRLNNEIAAKNLQIIKLSARLDECGRKMTFTDLQLNKAKEEVIEYKERYELAHAQLNLPKELRNLSIQKLKLLQSKLRSDLEEVEKVLYLENAKKCMKCEENNRTVTLEPCNHFLLCDACACSVTECPYCQIPVATTHA